MPTGFAYCNGTNGTPDLRGRTIIGTGYYSDIYGSINNNIGALGGERMHQLTIAELPSHQHQSGYMVVGNIADYFPFGLGWTHSNHYTAGGNGYSVSSMTDSVGNSQAHSIMQPYMALHWIIKL